MLGLKTGACVANSETNGQGKQQTTTLPPAAPPLLVQAVSAWSVKPDMRRPAIVEIQGPMVGQTINSNDYTPLPAPPPTLPSDLCFLAPSALFPT